MCGPDEGQISHAPPRQDFCVRRVVFDFSLEHRLDTVGAIVMCIRRAYANIDCCHAIAKSIREDICRSESSVRDQIRCIELGRWIAHRRNVVNRLGYAVVAFRYFAFRATECARRLCLECHCHSACKG